MANAIGIVCSQPTGIRLMFGTYTKPLHAGKAAANGMLSALLARGGMTSSPVSLEAKRGFGFLLSDSPDPKPLEEAWDGPLMIMKNTYKPFAAASSPPRHRLGHPHPQTGH
jgi:2-methylcitrate dehydratase PrpD